MVVSQNARPCCLRTAHLWTHSTKTVDCADNYRIQRPAHKLQYKPDRTQNACGAQGTEPTPRWLVYVGDRREKALAHGSVQAQLLRAARRGWRIRIQNSPVHAAPARARAFKSASVSFRKSATCKQTARARARA